MEKDYQSSLLRLEGVSKAFGAVQAVHDISIDIKKGELVSFIGPSGCGKTTLLRTIAGFYTPDSGNIFLDGVKLNDLPPEKRATGMVFQDYALFPHMTIFENVAYGLDVQKRSKSEKKELVQEALAQVHLDGYENRKPRELSGGQQQRVAIARCLVLKPKVLLLDEPLSNLDAHLRKIMRDEIRRLKEELDLTIIFVTHDQDEALSISDRVMVLKEGELQQVDKPEIVYQRPANEFVAHFVGHANLLPGKIDTKNGKTIFITEDLQLAIDPPQESIRGNCLALIRPEMIDIQDDGTVEGIIQQRIYNGSSVRYEVKVANTEFIVDTYNVQEKEMLNNGQMIKLRVPKRLHFIQTPER